MIEKKNLKCVIRPYTPTDKTSVISLFRFGVLEHVYPAFFKAMSHPDHIGVTLSVSVAGYVLGGSSYFQALLFGGAWACLVYYCCHEIYESFLNRKLEREMADIQGNFLDNPMNHFWVAETEEDGKSKVVGFLAVVSADSKRLRDILNDTWNGSVKDSADVFQVIVSSTQRRKGLGSQLLEKAIGFCKDQGLLRVVVELTSTQTAAVALFLKLGFTVTSENNMSLVNSLYSKLTRINVIRMEKDL
ncbi:hypothetical protein DNTS_002183 [Danionella cerebrum]|uniref:N-acetyltransferase domain-containing protein n=1 Tax=Danionella cerebrum TaxID=2873325 RepID=A0A553QX82_9TELE|nr:hypothetical protein DNTS_002183 [Danionella translucida]